LSSINPIADLPMGFGMALVQDYNSMQYFASLSLDAQRAIIDQTRSINSKDEMQSFVQSLASH
jgi:hypothetical protein